MTCTESASYRLGKNFSKLILESELRCKQEYENVTMAACLGVRTPSHQLARVWKVGRIADVALLGCVDDKVAHRLGYSLKHRVKNSKGDGTFDGLSAISNRSAVASCVVYYFISPAATNHPVVF